jgi:energy-coupling factor transport system substrate-specific component
MNDFKREFQWLTPLLIAVGIGLDILGGQLAVSLKLPLFLDSIGTILVGALVGPWVGALTGYLASMTWTITGLLPTAMGWSSVGVVIGILAGVFTSWGWMRNWWNAIVSGLVCGLLAVTIATPILTIVYGNIGDKGTNLINQVFQSLGLSAFVSNLVTGLFSDPLDKVISFLVVWGILKLIPRTLKERYRPAEQSA